MSDSDVEPFDIEEKEQLHFIKARKTLMDTKNRMLYALVWNTELYRIPVDENGEQLHVLSFEVLYLTKIEEVRMKSRVADKFTPDVLVQ